MGCLLLRDPEGLPHVSSQLHQGYQVVAGDHRCGVIEHLIAGAEPNIGPFEGGSHLLERGEQRLVRFNGEG